MINHFNDIAIHVSRSFEPLDIDLLLGELKLFELCDSRVEVNPRDTKKMVKRIKKDLKKGGV